MGHRRSAREYAVQALFQIDLNQDDADAVFRGFWSERDVSDDVRAFAEQLVRGVSERQGEIDRRIVAAAENWRIERMAVVDRNVLRLAVFELTTQTETPPAVVIDEAVEIAKRFGSGDSGGFINGILDSIRKSCAGGSELGAEC